MRGTAPGLVAGGQVIQHQVDKRQAHPPGEQLIGLMAAGCLLSFLIPLLFIAVIFVAAVVGGTNGHKP